MKLFRISKMTSKNPCRYNRKIIEDKKIKTISIDELEDQINNLKNKEEE